MYRIWRRFPAALFLGFRRGEQAGYQHHGGAWTQMVERIGIGVNGWVIRV